MKLRRQRKDEELDAEIRSHLDEAICDRIARGETPDEARANALREFGNVTLVKEVTREMWGWSWLEALRQDVRLGLRMLRKQPGFTLIAIVTLALGIGPNILMFGLLNAVLMKPISGVENSDELVVMLQIREGGGFDLISYPDYKDYRDRNQAFSGLLAYRSVSLNLSGGEFPERLYGAVASGNYFSVLGVDVALGRAFGPEEDQTPGAHPVAVISHQVWHRQFGGDPGVVGRTIRLNSHPFTLIGVMPPEFKGTETGEIFDVWVPLMMQAQARPQMDTGATDILNLRDKNWLWLIGRIKPGVSLSRAKSEMGFTALQLRQAYPRETGKTTGVELSPHVGLGPVDYLMASQSLGLLMAIVGLVLLIACANVANLLLVRAATRRKEVAVRLALGASRLRIIRQFLTENLLIATLGTVAGLLIPFVAKDWLLSLLVRALNPASLNFTLDRRVAVFTVALSLATALLFGLAPALQSSKPDLVPELKESAAGGGSRRWRLSGAFVAAQIATSFVLLTGAGLMVRTLQKVYTVEPGFDTHNMLTLTFDLIQQGYTEPQGRQFFRQLLERASALPGASAAGLASILPLGWGTNSREVLIDGQPPTPDSSPLTVDHNIVTPGYFQLMGTPLIAGRDFTERDGAEAVGVVIVNETMARRFWPRQNPIGKTFALGGPKPRPVEVVGVARDSKFYNLQEEARTLMYLPFLQNYDSYMTLHLRTTVEALSLAAAVRREVRHLDPDLPFIEIKTMEQQLDDSIWPQRTMSTLIILFGALALLLAAVGLHGVLSYTVAERTREIGIRLALGAQRGAVLRLVVRQGLKLALLGCAIGLPAAYALTRLMANFIYGVSATDPLTFMLIPALLVAVALLACYFPARRATKVDPLIALRHE